MAKVRRRKNPAAVALGRLGGRVSSPAKKRAATIAAKVRWARYAAAKKAEAQ